MKRKKSETMADEVSYSYCASIKNHLFKKQNVFHRVWQNIRPLSNIRNLLFSEVAPLVVAHITLGSEAFAAALGADKGAFVTVNSYMNLQILLLAKGF